MKGMKANKWGIPPGPVRSAVSGRWFIYCFRDGKRILQGLPGGYATEKEARSDAARYSSP